MPPNTKFKRRFYNQTLGIPSDVENEKNQADANNYNQAAANQYSAKREAAFADTSEAEGNATSMESSRVAIAKALGEDPNNAPPLQAMMARFYSAPVQVQAEIYKRGGAQFIDGKTGMKLLESATKNKVDALDTHADSMGSQIANGKIKFKKDAKGIPYGYREETDALNPGKVTETPLGEIEKLYLTHGFQSGRIPNPFNPQSTDTGVTPPVVRSQTAAEFQKVLDTRAATNPSISASTDYARMSPAMQASNPDMAPIAPRPAAFPARMSTASADTALSMATPAMGVPMNSALRARQVVGQVPGMIDQGVDWLNQLGRDAGDAVAQTYGTDVPNFLHTLTTGNTDPLVSTNAVPAQLSAMDAVMSAEEIRRRKREGMGLQREY